MARDVVFAANSLMSASDAWLTEVARRDPDMIRDVAAAMLARHNLLRPFAAKADKWEASHPGSVGVRRQDSKQIQHRLGDFRKAREAFPAKPDPLRNQPCRAETNIAHPENGDCLRCAAANGEACNK